MAVELEELALVPGEDDQAVGQRLWPVYDGLPAQTVQKCEAERLLIVSDVRKHLDAVYDALEGTGRFRKWCAAAAFSERECHAAESRASHRRKKLQISEVEVQISEAADWTDPDDCRFLHKSLDLVTSDEIAPGSVAAIITDPPYGQEAIPAYYTLGWRASHWLRPGGSLIVMAGTAHLPKLLHNLLAGAQGDLLYHWTLCYLFTDAEGRGGGGRQQMFQRSVFSQWKPLLWLTKGRYAGEAPDDVVAPDDDIVSSGGRDKDFHVWGQHVAGFATLVERLTAPGELVVDPFVGGGTTALACYRSGRRFVGVDRDAQAIETSRSRLKRIMDEEDGADDGE